MSHNVRFRQFPSCRMRKLFFHFLILGTDKMPLPLKVKQYQQKFRPEWCKDKIYEKWLTAVTGNETVAGCRFCSKTFSAKLQNIKTNYPRDTNSMNKTEASLHSRPVSWRTLLLPAEPSQQRLQRGRRESSGWQDSSRNTLLLPQPLIYHHLLAVSVISRQNWGRKFTNFKSYQILDVVVSVFY